VSKKRRKLIKTICLKEGCNLPVIIRGHCRTHYRKGLLDGSIKRLKLTKGDKKDICIYEGCTAKPIYKNLCSKHYQRFQKYGTSKPTNRNKYLKLSYKERIKYNTKMNEKTNCWEWQKGKDKDGYGQIAYKGKNERSHRASYIEFVGEIPERMYVLHKCDNPSCCNPDHLFLGTPQDNMDDKIRKGRDAKGEKQGNSKLTRKKVVEIRKRFRKFKSFKEESRTKQCKKIAKEFNISYSHIRRLYVKQSWKHVLLLKP